MLTGVPLLKANLSGADCSRTDFTGANLTMADLSHAVVERAVFDKANLTLANLHAADISRASTAGANLTGMRGTDLALLRAENFRTPAMTAKG